jgi:acetyl-CoA carboxylase carboxyl transferase subunit alpha
MRRRHGAAARRPRRMDAGRLLAAGRKPPIGKASGHRLDFTPAHRQFRAPPAQAIPPKSGMRTYLTFEQAVADIDARIDELRAVATNGESAALTDEIAKLEARSEKALADLYASLTPWQKTQVARIQGRPHFSDYVKGLVAEFTPLAGDRYFGEDEAIVGGLGRFEGAAVCVIGQEKGHDTDSRLKHNFGMARPEGYRKAVRLMQLADRFDLPVIALVDTAGAFPGVEAEERGQAEAIARSTDACLMLGVPNVAVIIGEGGSGGAVAIATANKVLMLEHAIYTVASPEASASILWRDSSRAQDAATSMKITAQDLIKFGIIDAIVTEPVGGAHRDPDAAVAATGRAISDALKSLSNMSREELRSARAEKFLAMGRKM